MSTRLLQHLAVLLLLTHLTDSALGPKIKNHPQLKPQDSNIYIVRTNHLAKLPHFADLEHWYHSMVAAHSPRAANTTSGRILYTYHSVMHGFAVQLTGDEARRMTSYPGVTGVHKDMVFYPQTTRSPGFMGLDPHYGAWNETDFGDGVIIGIIDSGIWPESASFNDRGLGPVRASWKGNCVDADDFKATSCNNKLVGAKAFDMSHFVWSLDYDGTVPSPRDKDGHGTHVASTAAGAEVPDAGMDMFSRGTARGVAPKARIAIYRACDASGCNSVDIASAIDTAVEDGVDIISMSLGADHPIPLYADVIAMFTFGAVRNGVFVAVSGGNAGPGASTVVNSVPWLTTVGAGTVDRLFPVNLTLGNGVVLAGQSLYAMKANGTGMVQLVTMDCDVSTEDELDQIFTPDKVMGKIVVCMTGAGVIHGMKLQKVGGAGLVSVEVTGWSRDGIPAFAFTLPALTISYTAGEKLRAYMASSANPVASFSFGCETVTEENRAPEVAGFSSRGPNPIVPQLLKPDIVAPGVNILAAWSGDASLSGDDDDGRRVQYNIVSGTSMATPHVAGVAALIKKKYPHWTPAMIQSALMTTAGTLDNMNRDILDDGATKGRHESVVVATPFAAGAGHVRPNLALDPGLVYDAGERDYLDFLCALNYTAGQMRLFVPDFVKCNRALPGGVAGLNYPSFLVVFDNHTTVRTLMRTVTMVSVKTETYNVTYMAPDRVKVTVKPTTLEFTKPNEKKSYTVEFKSLAGGNLTPEWDFGHISWESKDHLVRSPVAFQWKN